MQDKHCRYGALRKVKVFITGAYVDQHATPCFTAGQGGCEPLPVRGWGPGYRSWSFWHPYDPTGPESSGCAGSPQVWRFKKRPKLWSRGRAV